MDRSTLQLISYITFWEAFLKRVISYSYPFPVFMYFWETRLNSANFTNIDLIY